MGSNSVLALEFYCYMKSKSFNLKILKTLKKVRQNNLEVGILRIEQDICRIKISNLLVIPQVVIKQQFSFLSFCRHCGVRESSSRI